MFCRDIAPAGAPFRLRDLARWAALVVSRTDVDALARQIICGRFGVRYCFLTSTGRAGLTLLLKALRRLGSADQDEVIVPSYTCFSVAASIVKAGLRPRVVDVLPETLDYALDELERADFSGVLAIVATNLYGLPSDLPAISRLARQKHVFLIDDAAQAMGAQVGGRWCGTWGDAGLFSLDKGKNVSAIDGGIVVTNSDAVAAAVEDELKSVSTQGFRESAVGAIKALVYWLFLRPWLYWIPNAIPQLRLGTTVYTTAFDLGRPPRALVALAAVMLERLDEFTCARAVNASAFSTALMRVTGVEMIRPAPGAAAVYLRLPVLFESSDARQLALELLRRAGLGASPSYPSSLADVPELQHRLVASGPTVGGRYIASRILTLPTHSFVRDRDIQRAVEIIAKCTDRLPEEAAVESRRKQVDLVKL